MHAYTYNSPHNVWGHNSLSCAGAKKKRKRKKKEEIREKGERKKGKDAQAVCVGSKTEMESRTN